MRSVVIRVSGKVQGVFYRASTKSKADELGVKGFVRNEPDGSVYIEAEGSEEILQEFITWCKQGPSRAVVANADVKSQPSKNFTEFIVSR